MASVRDKLPAFIAEIENGFPHETLLTVIQKIYFEYWLRLWLIYFHSYTTFRLFLPPLHTLKQITDGVCFRAPTSLSGASIETEFNPALLKTVGEERLAWAPPSSEDGYQHYKDRYWYMDYYEGPYPVTDDVSPVEAGLTAIANRSAFVLPGDDSPGPRLHSYNIHPYLKPTDIDTTSPYDPEGSHETYLTDLNYNGLAPGFNQNTAHVFLSYIIPRLLNRGFFAYYRKHAPPYGSFLSLDELFDAAGVEGGHGLLERVGTSSAYSLARPKVYVDILKILQALKIYRVVHKSPYAPSVIYMWHEDSKTITYYTASAPPDAFVGTLGQLLHTSLESHYVAYRTPHPKCPILYGKLNALTAYPYTPIGPPYSLAQDYQPRLDPYGVVYKDHRALRLDTPSLSLSDASWFSRYWGTGEPVTGIMPIACRYLDSCSIKQVHQQVNFSGWNADWSREPVKAITARPWRMTTSWGAEVSMPSGFTMPDGYNVNIPFRNGWARQEVSVSAFESSLVREHGELEVACEFRDHYPPPVAGLPVTNILRTGLTWDTHPWFDCIIDATGAFELFLERDGLPVEWDWQVNPFDETPYIEWYNQ